VPVPTPFESESSFRAKSPQSVCIPLTPPVILSGSLLRNSCESEAVPVQLCSEFSIGSRTIRVQAMSMVANSATISLSSNSGSTTQINKDVVCVDDVAPFVQGFPQELELSFCPSLSVSSFFYFFERFFFVISTQKTAVCYY
jgi:hypothetical protein